MTAVSTPLNAPTRSRRCGKRFLRWIGRGFLALCAIISMLALLGASYEAIASQRDAQRFPAPGQLVDVGGYRLHIQCIGEGSPTVVLEAGQGTTALEWATVHPDLAKTTQVCAYDRAGIGWSDPSPLPRTPRNIAVELHTLLQKAGIQGQYVLVGASLGGKYIRMYAQQHPDEVAGVVFLDARHEHFEALASEVLSTQKRLFPVVISWPNRFLSGLGIARLFKPELVAHPQASPEMRQTLSVLKTRPSAIDAAEAEFFDQWTDGVDLQRESLGDTPVIVLAAGKGGMQMAGWGEAQQAMADLSSNGKLVVLAESGHAIQADAPEQVITAVNEVVAAARQR